MIFARFRKRGGGFGGMPRNGMIGQKMNHVVDAGDSALLASGGEGEESSQEEGVGGGEGGAGAVFVLEEDFSGCFLRGRADERRRGMLEGMGGGKGRNGR